MYNYLFYLGAIITGLIALYKIELPKRQVPIKKQKLKWTKVLLSILAIIIPIILTIVDFKESKKNEKIKAKSGEIQSFKKTIGTIVIGRRDSDTSKAAKFTNLSAKGFDFGIAEDAKMPLIKGYLEDDKLVLDAIIRDSHGKF